MKTATLVALKAILEADPVRTHADREQLMHTLGLAEGGTQAQPDRIIPIEEAAKRLNRTKRSLHYLARKGALKKFKIPGFIRACGVRESDLNALIQGAACG
jgi:hypothetical protein